MAIPSGEFIWYELTTTDSDAACRFYENVVGWRITDSGMPDMDYRLLNAAETSVGGVFALNEEMLGGGARPAWLGYVEVADVDESVADIEADGGSTLVSPRDIPNVGRFAMIADPQGIPLYVMHSTSGDASQAFDAAGIGHCAWNELATPNLQKALSFYTGNFGWTLGESMPMGDLGDYQMFDQGGRPIGGMMTAAPEGSPAMWRFYFRVPSLKRAIAAIESGGGSVIHGPQEVPGDDEILIGIDPQGAQFALVAKR